jgi:hypothetical protein
MSKPDVIAILLFLSSLSGGSTIALAGGYVDTIAPGWGVKTIAVLSLAALVAGAILRTYANKSNAPAQAIVAGAPIVPADTTVYDQVNTPVVAQNAAIVKGQILPK